MIPLFASATKIMLLAVEAQQVMHLRLHRLGIGGSTAVEEASLMVREKIETFVDTIGAAMAGGSFESVVDDYRIVVRANIERLKLAD